MSVTMCMWRSWSVSLTVNWYREQKRVQFDSFDWSGFYYFQDIVLDAGFWIKHLRPALMIADPGPVIQDPGSKALDASGFWMYVP